jgi:hypothetical protein
VAYGAEQEFTRIAFPLSFPLFLPSQFVCNPPPPPPSLSLSLSCNCSLFLNAMLLTKIKEQKIITKHNFFTIPYKKKSSKLLSTLYQTNHFLFYSIKNLLHNPLPIGVSKPISFLNVENTPKTQPHSLIPRVSKNKIKKPFFSSHVFFASPRLSVSSSTNNTALILFCFFFTSHSNDMETSNSNFTPSMFCVFY